MKFSEAEKTFQGILNPIHNEKFNRTLSLLIIESNSFCVTTNHFLNVLIEQQNCI